jgi:hypothetical protein
MGSPSAAKICGNRPFIGGFELSLMSKRRVFVSVCYRAAALDLADISVSLIQNI